MEIYELVDARRCTYEPVGGSLVADVDGLRAAVRYAWLRASRSSSLMWLTLLAVLRDAILAAQGSLVAAAELGRSVTVATSQLWPAALSSADPAGHTQTAQLVHTDRTRQGWV